MQWRLADSIMLTPSWTRMGTWRRIGVGGRDSVRGDHVRCLSLRSTARIWKSTSFSTSASHARARAGASGRRTVGFRPSRGDCGGRRRRRRRLPGGRAAGGDERPWTGLGTPSAATGTPPAAARGRRNVRGGIPRGRQRRSVDEVVADDAGCRAPQGVDADGAPGASGESAVRDEDAGRGEDAGCGRGTHGRDVGGAAVSERVPLSIARERRPRGMSLGSICG